MEYSQVKSLENWDGCGLFCWWWEVEMRTKMLYDFLLNVHGIKLCFDCLWYGGGSGIGSPIHSSTILFITTTIACIEIMYHRLEKFAFWMKM